MRKANIGNTQPKTTLPKDKKLYEGPKRIQAERSAKACEAGIFSETKLADRAVN